MRKGFSSWTSARRRRSTRAHEVYGWLSWVSHSCSSLLNELLGSDCLYAGRIASDCGHARLPWHCPANGVGVRLIPILARFRADSIATSLSRLVSRALLPDRAGFPGRTRLFGDKFRSIVYCWSKVKRRDRRTQLIGCPSTGITIFSSAYSTQNTCSRPLK
jgi:hypothetical protein